jgi:hypothetical protein
MLDSKYHAYNKSYAGSEKGAEREREWNNGRALFFNVYYIIATLERKTRRAHNYVQSDLLL